MSNKHKGAWRNNFKYCMPDWTERREKNICIGWSRKRDRDGSFVQQLRMIRDVDGNILTVAKSVMGRLWSVQIQFICINSFQYNHNDGLGI